MSKDIAIQIAKRQKDLQEDVFRSPPANYLEFLKRLGIWIGLSDALSIIEDARKGNEEDD